MTTTTFRTRASSQRCYVPGALRVQRTQIQGIPGVPALCFLVDTLYLDTWILRAMFQKHGGASLIGEAL